MLYLRRPKITKCLTFVVEAVDAVDGSTFVVAAEKEEVFGVFDFVGEQEADGFEGVLAPVDVIAKEEVVAFGGVVAVLEQPDEIVVLTVDVA